MQKKDYFSAQAKQYAAFRPIYPEALYDFLFGYVKGYSCAWDCGTGNGQVAQRLARRFAAVYATDISAGQISHARRAENISYTLDAAEKTAFADGQFDLITVAQAIHWFDVSAFYREVRRTAKSGALLAVWGYTSPSLDAHIDRLFRHFYSVEVGAYWDPARKVVEGRYKDIPFPFREIPCPGFTIEEDWTLDRFTGYLGSWSATQAYIRARGADPVQEFRRKLSEHWPADEVKRVTFPIFMRLGIVK